MTRAAFRNAIVTVLALGGSTNAIIHLIAMARRIGVELSLADFEELARVTPLLANIRPSGKYLMEDFFYAGGLPALLKQLGDLLDTSAITVNGKTLGENIARREGVQRGRHPDHARPDRREQHPRGAARQPRPGRRGDQAGGGRGAAAPAHGAGRRLRQLRRHGRPDRRPGPRHRRELGDRAAQRRPAGCAGDARVGPAADPEEDPREGDPRHGADLRRADVRHQLRLLRAARRAGEPCRRPAGARADRRPDRAGRAGPRASSSR